MSFQITRPAIITDEAMGDIVTAGFESGYYGSVRVKRYIGPDKPPPWAADLGDGKPWPRYTWAWAIDGGGIAVVAAEGEEKGTITRATLASGLVVLGNTIPRLLAQLVEENYDVIAADALLQAAAFGEVIYG